MTNSGQPPHESAYGIEVEAWPNRRWLNLRNGSFALRQKVFLVVDGERTDITTNSRPPDSPALNLPPDTSD